MSTKPMSQVERNLIWDSNKKNAAICASCPFEKSPCLLSGVPTRSCYNLFFLFESPDKNCIEHHRPMFGSTGRLIKKISQVVDPIIGSKLDVSVAYAIGAECKKAAPLTATVKCVRYLSSKLCDAAEIAAYNARVAGLPEPVNVVVPFGTGACRALKLQGNSIDKMRGIQQAVTVNGVQYTAVPTLSLRHLHVNPNWVNQIIIDVKIALKVMFENYAPESIDTISREYVLPTTIAEVRDVCDEIIHYTDPKKQPDPDKWPIAVDTETTGLRSYVPHQRIIMASFAWDTRKATAFALDHKDAPYDPKEAWKHANRVLMCKKPKILHNLKYDWKWLTYVARVPTFNLWWDTMLAEHFLNESAKGYYSLKVLALSYALHYAGYETQLKGLLLDANKDDNLGAIVQYESAKIRGLLGDNKRLAQLEEEYTRAFFEWSMLKKKSPERKAADKLKTSLRGKIARIYKKAGIEMPRTAELSVATDYSDAAGLFETVPMEILQKYAAVDADLTRVVCRQQRRILMRSAKKDPDGPCIRDANHIMETLYLPGTFTLGRMEQRGFRFDQDGANEYEEEILACRDEYKERLEQTLCVDADTYNFNSPTALATIFVDVLGLEYDSLMKTDTGKISTKAEALTSMKEQYAGTRVGDFCHNLLVFRSANMAVNTFLKNLRKQSAADGRIHCSFHLNGTATGRLSSSRPNMQNQPPFMCRQTYKGPDGEIIDSLPGWSIKRLFVPSNDKYAIFNVDISAAEIRVLCAYLDETDPLRQAVEEGMGVPSFITSRVFGKRIWNEHMNMGPDDVFSEDLVYEFVEEHKDTNADINLLRVACKRVLYGTLYGAGPYTIAEQIYGGLAGDEAEAAKQIQFARDVQAMFFDMSPGTKNYVYRTGREALTKGYVRSMFGRYRRFPMVSVDDRKMAGKAKRESTNFKIQSAASDLVISQLIEIEEALEMIGGRALITVHDSVAGEIRKENVMELPAFFDHWIVKRVKEKFPWLPVPYEYGLEVGINYKDLVPIEKIINDDLSEKEYAICKAIGLRP